MAPKEKFKTKSTSMTVRNLGKAVGSGHGQYPEIT